MPVYQVTTLREGEYIARVQATSELAALDTLLKEALEELLPPGCAIVDLDADNFRAFVVDSDSAGPGRAKEAQFKLEPLPE